MVSLLQSPPDLSSALRDSASAAYHTPASFQLQARAAARCPLARLRYECVPLIASSDRLQAQKYCCFSSGGRENIALTRTFVVRLTSSHESPIVMLHTELALFKICGCAAFLSSFVGWLKLGLAGFVASSSAQAALMVSRIYPCSYYTNTSELHSVRPPHIIFFQLLRCRWLLLPNFFFVSASQKFV